ncbi:MAG TPA: hypothetical protein VNO75_10085 [Gemmatimonadaceae bacterium]|nr:hypothetical protein [Gemmatimonadaceae bacterium]
MPIPKRWIPGVRQIPLHPGDPDYVSTETREDCVRRSLRSRLKGICGKLSSADFDALIQQMVIEQLRGEGITGMRVRLCQAP